MIRTIAAWAVTIAAWAAFGFMVVSTVMMA